MYKNIVIAGGTGFIGEALENHFLSKGHQVHILSRNPCKDNHIFWDGKTIGTWINVLNKSDVLINLCGKCVDCRYTPGNKKAILESRLLPTQLLQKAIDQVKQPPSIWLNASSATIYRDSRDIIMTEKDGVIGDDFSMNVCKSWEGEFYKISTPNVRKASLRMSIILGNKGAAFPKLKMTSRLGFGGHHGDGQQKVSWIHIDDVCDIISFILNNDGMEGPINITSPSPIPNKQFMSALRRILLLPFGLINPKWMLELGTFLMRTETELLLKSRNVYPQKLIEEGYKFKFADVNDAFKNLIEVK